MDAGLDTEARSRAAGLLLGAYRHGTPAEPLVGAFPEMTVTDAYAVQRIQVERWMAEGARIKGHKVGLASAAMQRQMGVDQPDYGHLMDGMFQLEGLPLPLAGYLQPRVEPEIAFVLERPLRGPGVTVAEAVRAVALVLPALEIVDSRIRDWRISIVDTIADNASSGGVVLGSRPCRLSEVDVRLAGCVLYRNGQVVGTGAGGAVLGSPINALVWLANTVGPQGVALEPGHVVLPGSVMGAVPVAVGDTVTAIFGGLGSLTACFDTACFDKEQKA